MNDNTPAPDPGDANAVRMVQLIGEVREDGAVARYDVVRLVRVPAALLRADAGEG